MKCVYINVRLCIPWNYWVMLYYGESYIVLKIEQ